MAKSSNSLDLEVFYSQNILNEKELEILSKKIVIDKSYIPDPATVYQAYETGKKIYDLFNKGDKRDELMEYLKKEIKLIKQLLKDVLTRLEEIKVLIKSEFRDNAVNDLESILRIFNESFDTWWKYPNREDVKREVSEVFVRLKEYNRKAQEYGYAHFHTIWIAVIFELILLEYNKRPKKEIKEILKNHLDYFTTALKPELHGSIASAFNQINKIINDESSKFPTKDYVKTYYESRGNCDFTYEQTLKISGDYFSGFEFRITEPKQIKRTCGGGGHQGTGGGGHLYRGIEVTTQLLGTELNLNAIRNSYTKARENYLNLLLPIYNDSQLAFNCCNFYKKSIEGLLQN